MDKQKLTQLTQNKLTPDQAGKGGINQKYNFDKNKQWIKEQ